MSLNVTDTPVPVRIIPQPIEPQVYVALAIAVAFAVGFLALYAFYRPRKIYLTVQKRPDGTYKLRTAWGWHNFSAYENQYFKNLEETKQRIVEILDKTEWKPL